MHANLLIMGKKKNLPILEHIEITGVAAEGKAIAKVLSDQVPSDKVPSDQVPSDKVPSTKERSTRDRKDVCRIGPKQTH